MQIRPSSALRNEYTQISELAKASGEPIFITNKGEDDGVYMGRIRGAGKNVPPPRQDLCRGDQQTERRACLHTGGA